MLDKANMTMRKGLDPYLRLKLKSFLSTKPVEAKRTSKTVKMIDFLAKRGLV